MLGLPTISEDIPTLYDDDFQHLGYPMYREISGYGKYMNEYRQEQGAVSKTGHSAFIFFWLCKFFICSKSLAMLKDILIM